MDNFLNGFLKAWRSWRNDGREVFMRAFLQEVQQAKPHDSEHFFAVLKQEMQAVSAARSVADQQDILAISDYIDTLKEEITQELTELQQQQHTQDNKLDEPQTEVQDQELGQVQEDLEQQAPTQDISTAKGEQEATKQLEQAPESLEEQELLQSLGIFQDEIQEVLAEHPNRAEQAQEPEDKDLAEEKQESNLRAVEQPEQLDKSEQGLEVTNKTPEPQQTPPQATDIENKYAKLHSYFKQVELDVQQKRIKTKSDFKESFLNYAKSHMTEAELKVLLVLSQKQPSKLTQEHRNLINDALEQAHGNKHMQDRGLQLSVKAVLGHPLEAEHYTTIHNYVQQCQASLEPMDGKVAGAMDQYLAKMQKSKESPTESQASQQEATQAEALAEPRQNSTPLSTDQTPKPSTTPATPNSTTQQEVEQKPRVHLGSDELDQQTQAHHQVQPALNNMPIPELWIESQNSSKPWLETQTQGGQVSHTQTTQQELEQKPRVHLGSDELDQQAQTNTQAQPVANNTPTRIPEPWLDAPAKPRGRRR